MPRRRNKAATREEILAAARSVLASDGPDALSLSKVAHLAGVNRGTAYQHFETREELIKATVASVSEQLSEAMFADTGVDSEGHWQGESTERPVYDVIGRVVNFAVENPALCRIWLFEVLSSDNPSDDLFFRQFKDSTEELVESEDGQDNVDAEALSVIMLAGYFLWPVWVDAHAKNDQQRDAMSKRMLREVLRLNLHGVLRKERFPQLQQLMEKDMLPEQ